MRRVIVVTMAIVAMLFGAGPGAAVVVDETEAVGASALKAEDIDTSSPVLDDFNDGGVKNRWGGDTGGFNDKGIIGVSNTTGAPQEGLFALRLDFDVSQVNGFAGYFSKLQSKDLSGYTAISFWVRGQAGGEFFKVEMKNNSNQSAAVHINDYLDGGVTTGWKQVIIPIDNFANITDWTSAKELVFTFVYTMCYTIGSPYVGTIFIDKIEFLSSTINVVRIDHFGDNIGTSTLGGKIGSMGGMGGSASETYSDSVFHNYRFSLRSQYNVNVGWAGLWFKFGGGNDLETPIPHDFSSYNYISFYAKAQSAGENPKSIIIELADNAGNRSYQLSGITTSWQYFKTPLSSFSGLSKTSIKQMNIVYSDVAIANAGGSKVGVLYIDEIQFEK